MLDFSYEAMPSRIVFGEGKLATVGDEVERLGAKTALVLSTPEQRGSAEDVSRLLGEKAAGIYDQAKMHVPIETAEAARSMAKELGADCCVAIGGGSTIGLGKAIAMTSGLPIIAIPTTFAGSEVTAVYGLTENGVKRTGKDIAVLPKTVIYDPMMTATLPARIAGPSGMNAIAHAVEGLYSEQANPVMSLMAEECIRALSSALPRVVADQSDIEAASDALYGAWLGGTVLGSVGMALHHKICHTLGGTFNLPHAEMHTIMLPHSVAYNRRAAPDAMHRVSRALGGAEAATGLYDLAKSLGAEMALSEIGMPQDGLAKAAKLAVQNPYYNPRPVTEAEILVTLENAFSGVRPATED